jgi:phage-related tail fiber protein
MTAKFFAILTNQGAAALANATALGTRVDLTHIAVGDGGGVLPTPDAAQTALKGEKRRAAINLLTIDPGNDSQIIAEQIIPENEGGWWIREIGLFSTDGTLIAVANCPETYKPQLQEGSGRTQTIRMVLIVSSTEAVTLKIDPAVVLATRQYVDEQIGQHAKSRNHPNGTLKEKGFVQLSSATDSNNETLAATPKAVKAAYDLAKGGLAKDQNGADILDIDEFFNNLGLKSAAKRGVGNGDAQLPDMSFFQGLKEGNGIQYLPSGIVIQWGMWTLPPVGNHNAESVGGTTWYTHFSKPFYHIAFPNVALINFINLAGSTFESQTSEFNTFVRPNMSAGPDGIAGSRTQACVSVTSRVLGYTPTIHWYAIGN